MLRSGQSTVHYLHLAPDLRSRDLSNRAEWFCIAYET